VSGGAITYWTTDQPMSPNAATTAAAMPSGRAERRRADLDLIAFIGIEVMIVTRPLVVWH
jgi:hypothetical protein